MSILAHRTEVPAEKTAAEIQTRLVKARAQAVLMECDREGVLTHLSFRVDTKRGVIAFRLPANVDGVHRLLLADAKLTRAQRGREQAARVAWRICKTWVVAQLAVIEAGMAQLPEVFLPYAQDPATGETVYERFERQGLPALGHDARPALPAPDAA